MKICNRCGVEKLLDDFYTHSKMPDGYLNQCKECKKKQVHETFEIKKEDKIWVEKEKERSREKYYRLGYRDKNKPSYENKKITMQKYLKKYPEKYLAKNAISHFLVEKGYQSHHWSYNKEHWKDIIVLTIQEHALLHRNMEYDQETMMYRDLKGHLLNTKELHLEYFKTLLI